MKTTIQSALFLGAALVCAGLSGCASSNQSADNSQDAATAQNIRQALDSNGGEKFASVHVNVRDGVAKLSGTVETTTAKWEAGDIAAHVSNVRDTVNRLWLPVQTPDISNPPGQIERSE